MKGVQTSEVCAVTGYSAHLMVYSTFAPHVPIDGGGHHTFPFGCIFFENKLYILYVFECCPPTPEMKSDV